MYTVLFDNGKEVIELKSKRKPVKIVFDRVLAQTGMGESYEGYGKNEMETEGFQKNEMKNLGEIFVRIGEKYLVRLMDIRDVVRNTRKQIDGRVIEDYGYIVTKNGKQVLNLKRRNRND